MGGDDAAATDNLSYPLDFTFCVTDAHVGFGRRPPFPVFYERHLDWCVGTSFSGGERGFPHVPVAGIELALETRFVQTSGEAHLRM